MAMDPARLPVPGEIVMQAATGNSKNSDLPLTGWLVHNALYTASTTSGSFRDLQCIA